MIEFSKELRTELESICRLSVTNGEYRIAEGQNSLEDVVELKETKYIVGYQCHYFFEDDSERCPGSGSFDIEITSVVVGKDGGARVVIYDSESIFESIADIVRPVNINHA